MSKRQSGGFDGVKGAGLGARLRLYLLTGLLVLGPTALSLWVLVQAFQLADGLLGRYVNELFPALRGRPIPGLGLLAILFLLLVTGWAANLLAGVAFVHAAERALSRLPVFRSIYNPAKQLGEALFSGRRTAFHQVVLVQWPHPGAWRIGFVTTPPPRALGERVGAELVSVFVPSTPNPTSGFYHLFPADRVVPVDLTVEQGVQMIVSGGVVRPPDDEVRARSGAAATLPAATEPAAPERSSTA
jgi:uncharacterized membrane protein